MKILFINLILKLSHKINKNKKFLRLQKRVAKLLQKEVGSKFYLLSNRKIYTKYITLLLLDEI